MTNPDPGLCEGLHVVILALLGIIANQLRRKGSDPDDT